MPRQKIIQSPYQSSRFVIEQILTGFIRRLDYLTELHSQVSVCHFTITIPAKSEYSAKFIGQSLSCLRKKLKTLHSDSQTGWVREISPNDIEHFHVGFLWDSSKIQSAVTLKALLVKFLAEATNAQISSISVNINPPNPIFDRQFELNCCSNKTLKIRKGHTGFYEQRNNIINWLSYLAKVETKGGHQEKHIREYGFSLCNRKELGYAAKH